MYRATPPSRELATWVSSGWRETVSPGSHEDGVHPDATIDIVWDGSDLVVFGPRTRSGGPADPGTGALVGVSLRHGSTRAMLGETAGALADRIVPLESLWGSAGRVATARLGAAGSTHSMAELCSILSERGRALMREPDRLIPRVVELAALGTTVRGIANEVGLSDRQLFRRCVDEVGYGPKYLVRVLRFQRLLGLARRLPDANLAVLAVAAGYADQPHMSRECRALTGVTPARLVHSQRHLSR